MKIKLKPKTIKIKWVIDGFPDIVIGEDKKLYHQSNLREIKMCLIGYTKGYFINRKFYSLFRLRPLIRKIEA